LIWILDSRFWFPDVVAAQENGFVARQIRLVGLGPTKPIHEIESAAGRAQVLTAFALWQRRRRLHRTGMFSGVFRRKQGMRPDGQNWSKRQAVQPIPGIVLGSEWQSEITGIYSESNIRGI
jgi:hypothetical protein